MDLAWEILNLKWILADLKGRAMIFKRFMFFAKFYQILETSEKTMCVQHGVNVTVSIIAYLLHGYRKPYISYKIINLMVPFH